MSTTTASTSSFAGIPENRDRLFLASCVALIVTSMTFAIRAGILGDLTVQFGLSGSQLGWVNSMAFLGFPIAMIIGGLLYNSIGPRIMMYIAFTCHVLGLVLTITAGGFGGLLVSTFFIGFANGAVEAACNPLIADMYPDKKTEMLNKFHVWFPGGIVIGSLIARFFGEALGWQGLIGIMLVPTLIYAFLILGQSFPRKEKVSNNKDGEKDFELHPVAVLVIGGLVARVFRDTLGLLGMIIVVLSALLIFAIMMFGSRLKRLEELSANLRRLLNPLFLFIVLCMTMTAATEFSTTQWVEKILGASDANPMIVLALISGLMALGRFFAGPLIHRFNPAGVLWISAILATIGVFLLSTQSGAMVYVSAVVFALGICYFWPTMIGFVGEYLPKTGALGMSLVGGAGMFSLVLLNPVIGVWLENAANTAMEAGLTGNEADIVAGQATLSTMVWFPAILIVLFGGLYFYMRSRSNSDAVPAHG